MITDKAEYWLNLCDDDLQTAKVLLESNRLLHMGYFCHQIAEKALKAVVAYATSEIPPKTHDLQKLAVQGGIFESLGGKHLALFDKLTPLQIEARYPEHKGRVAEMLTIQYCKEILTETEAFLCWIRQQLGK
ncbi:MAG: HEPN domain-containing protein [Oscillospiraceae bacterium]|jgi:HEPN domain-containing protein|nr:HEPN domain-containing protein [Oscillospiraceae bacterium]